MIPPPPPISIWYSLELFTQVKKSGLAQRGEGRGGQGKKRGRVGVREGVGMKVKRAAVVLVAPPPSIHPSSRAERCARAPRPVSESQSFPAASRSRFLGGGSELKGEAGGGTLWVEKPPPLPQSG